LNKIENIDELIIKFLSGEASPDEAMLLEDWKAESIDNDRYYANSEKTILLFHAGQKPEAPDTKAAWEKVRSGIESVNVKPLNRKRFYLRIAASIALLTGIGFAVSLLFTKEASSELVYSTHGEPKLITLADGSHVTVSPHSSLSLEKRFGEKNRVIRLKGSAYFSVVHREEVPFIVDAGHVFIKDIGTKFSVRTSLDTDTVYVHVDEGIVLLFDSLGSELELRASEHALYVKSKKQLIRNLPEPTQDASLHFTNSRLSDVVALLNRNYATTIVLENSAIGNCTITTQFEKESLESILSIITETLGLSYQKTTKGYIIKGTVCHS